jgi:peptide/nickel transport system permease protein
VRRRVSARGVLAVGLTGTAILLALVGPYLAPFDPETPTADVLMPPSRAHPMGTDALGIDVLSIVLAAFRVDVLIALGAVSIAFVGGVALGAISGYSFNGSRSAGGVSGLILRALDLVQSIPVFIFALGLVGAIGPSIGNVVIAVAFVNLPLFARLTRTSVRSVESQEFVSACRALGRGEMSILVRHVLPNSLDSAVASASVAIGGAVLLTAGLSFIGAGVRPPTPELGALIANGGNYVITGQWWIGVLPGIVLSLIVLGFALSGDVARTAMAQARGGQLRMEEATLNEGVAAQASG